MSTSSPAEDQYIFQFILELYKNKFKNLIRTSKLKFSFRGLQKGIRYYEFSVFMWKFCLEDLGVYLICLSVIWIQLQNIFKRISFMLPVLSFSIFWLILMSFKFGGWQKKNVQKYFVCSIIVIITKLTLIFVFYLIALILWC